MNTTLSPKMEETLDIVRRMPGLSNSEISKLAGNISQGYTNNILTKLKKLGHVINGWHPTAPAHMAQLNELEEWATDHKGRVELIYRGLHPPLKHKISMHWECYVNGYDKFYHGYGASMPEAIERCHNRMATRRSGTEWRGIDLNT